jgi:two-component system LytT family sensor kinase
LATVRKNDLRAFIAISLFYWVVQLGILHGLQGFSWGITLYDSTVTILLLALAAWAIILLVRAYPTSVFIILYTLFISTIFTVIATMVGVQLLRGTFLKTDPDYVAWLQHTIFIRMFIIWLINGRLAMYTALTKKTTTLEHKFLLQADAATLLREAELFKLRQQLQPHFLYNSLNSISALIMIEPDKAQEMIGRLSDFLRSSVKREAQDKITINEELEYIQSYLDIESVRFGDRLQIVFEKSYTDDATIPPFLLQPILENAIKFGLYGKIGDVVITIQIALQPSYLSVVVTNPYDSKTQPPGGTGFGLEGVRRRLYLLFARMDLLETEGNEELFTTILKIPQVYV